jgi:hypothetical protein
MKLPESFHFLRPGWWLTHLVAIPLVGAAGFAVAMHHAGGHGHGAEHGHDDPHDHAAAAPASAGDAKNAVQAEMRLLERALSTGPASFAAADLTPLHHALHSVHAAKEKTETALAHGEYHLPKNADRLARFKQLDGDFHVALEQLADHAAKNELAPAAAAYGQVLGACNGCHSEFR